MKKTIIGIPRAFDYYRYGVLWKTFFEKIGCKVILSPKTNTKILELGIIYTSKECCLSYQIYIGHALILKDKCDYLFIPQIYNYGVKHQVCHCHQKAYELLKQLLSKKEILTCCIDHTNCKYQIVELFKVALKFTKNPLKIIYSYFYARKKQNNYHTSRQNENKNKLTKENKKVLIAAPFYFLQEEYYISNITKYLENNHITYLFSSYIDSKVASDFSLYYKYITPWKYYQELLGAIAYYKYQIDGLIIITPYQCEFIDFIEETLKFDNNHFPVCKLQINEDSSKIDFEEKLEIFLDIIKYNKKDF